ncbi:MAG TPA: mechanosensitive ion channel domain-containing protein [Cellvibrio sp.]|nr:mechanosensitive ion channel domain-containing protein [Cellvibrio sp.]
MFEQDQLVKFVEVHVTPWSLKIGLALIVFFIGQFFANLVSKAMAKVLGHTKLDKILIEFLRSVVRALLLVVVLVAALDQLGVNTNSLIAMLGAAGLAIGLALQSSLQNFAAGFMLLIFRPFKAGDFVEAAGTSGMIDSIGIFSTKLYTGDNKEVIIPNGAIYSGNIVNYSARKTRRIDMTFLVSYKDDIRLAKDLIQQVIQSDERILKEPAPQVAVGELAANGVSFVARPWTHSEHYWDVRFSLNEKIKLVFDEHKITIPHPNPDASANKAR